MGGMAKGLVLMSGGLDSQLAVRVCEDAGAYVEAVVFETPFFGAEKGLKAARQLGIPVTVVDFTDDEIALLKNPPHGFGRAMNPCIDCHAAMIRRAGAMMAEKGYDFVATGEVLNQRPMSQNANSLRAVEISSGLEGRLLRPLSALLLEPTIPEREGIVARERLLDLSGRRRDRQMELAGKFGIKEYPSPAGGCKLTEEAFGRKLKDLMVHEGLDSRRLVELLAVGRRFRLPGGSGVILGRDMGDNAKLEAMRGPGETLFRPVNVPGPTALVPRLSPCERFLVAGLVAAWSRTDRLEGRVVVRMTGDGHVEEMSIPRPLGRTPYLNFQIV